VLARIARTRAKNIPFTPATETERQVALAYSKLEMAAHARNSGAFAPMVADEFVATSSNNDKLQTKRRQRAEFDRPKDAGVVPTPLVTVRMYAFGTALNLGRPDEASATISPSITVSSGIPESAFTMAG